MCGDVRFSGTPNRNPKTLLRNLFIGSTKRNESCETVKENIKVTDSLRVMFTNADCLLNRRSELQLRLNQLRSLIRSYFLHYNLNQTLKNLKNNRKITLTITLLLTILRILILKIIV